MRRGDERDRTHVPNIKTDTKLHCTAAHLSMVRYWTDRQPLALTLGQQTPDSRLVPCPCRCCCRRPEQDIKRRGCNQQRVCVGLGRLVSLQSTALQYQLTLSDKGSWTKGTPDVLGGGERLSASRTRNATTLRAPVKPMRAHYLYSSYSFSRVRWGALPRGGPSCQNISTVVTG